VNQTSFNSSRYLTARVVVLWIDYSPVVRTRTVWVGKPQGSVEFPPVSLYESLNDSLDKGYFWKFVPKVFTCDQSCRSMEE
jgi:hypothetical protein